MQAETVLMIMRDAGMRNQKEVFTMRWEHLDWPNSRYFVYDSKTPKGRRHVPIRPRVLQALLTRYSDQKEGWVFPSKLQRVAISRRWPGNSRTLGRMPACRMTWFCTVRVTASELKCTGPRKNLFAVMKAMGHAAVATTMKYQHQDIDEIAHVARPRVQ